MRDNGRPELNFFTDTSFKHFQDCLDAEMKRLTAKGIGSNVKEAQAFSEDEENKLWNLTHFLLLFNILYLTYILHEY